MSMLKEIIGMYLLTTLLYIPVAMKYGRSYTPIEPLPTTSVVPCPAKNNLVHMAECSFPTNQSRSSSSNSLLKVLSE